MLTRLASGESADRVWFSLMDKTCAPANLQSAFEKVWRKGGSAGADAPTNFRIGSEDSKGWKPTECGTPQGGDISPLRANLYLNPLDHQMEKAGWELVRYADALRHPLSQ